MNSCWTVELHTNINLSVQVIFSEEEAADDGGPRREFFWLAVGAATSVSSLFSRPPSCKSVVQNTSALIEKFFLYVGNLIAMSLTQVGPGPVCFVEWMYDYWELGFDGVDISVDDIPDITIQDKLKEVSFRCRG